MKINILGMQLTNKKNQKINSLGCRDGNRRKRGIGEGRGRQKTLWYLPAELQNSQNEVPCPQIEREAGTSQSHPHDEQKISHIYSAEIGTSTFLREAAEKFLSASVDPELSGEKYSVKTEFFLFVVGPGRDACAGFCTQIGGIPAKNILPCHICAGTHPGDVGGVTELKKNLKNCWFGAVQVWEVTQKSHSHGDRNTHRERKV